jgi:glycine/D-amino acid oxidase-like deaminating enzyme
MPRESLQDGRRSAIISWRATAKSFEPPPAKLPSRTDVVVVGAGFTGVSAARVLAERGASVAVLEAHSLGRGAFTRNGGMMIVGLKHGTQVLVKQYGEDLERRMFETSVAAVRSPRSWTAPFIMGE